MRQCRGPQLVSARTVTARTRASSSPSRYWPRSNRSSNPQSASVLSVRWAELFAMPTIRATSLGPSVGEVMNASRTRAAIDNDRNCWPLAVGFRLSAISVAELELVEVDSTHDLARKVGTHLRLPLVLTHLTVARHQMRQHEGPHARPRRDVAYLIGCAVRRGRDHR